MSVHSDDTRRVTTQRLQEMKARGEKISMLTSYDYTMASIVDGAGIDVILVGAAAFLHDPEIVYLDEPTIGLDSESKLRIREFIRQMNEERHTTFIVTSHDFQDIESLCKRIILINHGEVVVDDGIQKIQKNYQSKKQIRFEMDQNPWLETDQFTMDGVTILDKTPYSLVLECEIQKVDAMAVVDQVSRACQILDISIQGQDIESIIREIVTERG